MKTLLFMLLFSTWASAQEIDPYVAFSVGIDARNAIVGSEPTNNKPELDILLGFQMVGWNKVECGIFYENFNRIAFQRYGAHAGYQIYFSKRIMAVPMIEGSMIDRGPVEREYVGRGNFLSYGAGASARYKISEQLQVALKWTLNKASDLDYLTGGSNWRANGTIEFIYCIKLKK